MARPAVQPARRRRRPQNALTGQLFIVNSGDVRHQGARRTYKQPAAVAEHGGRRTSAPASRARSRPAAARSATSGTIDVDNGFRPRGPVPALVDDGQRRRVVHRLRHRPSAGHDADAPPHAVPGAERRARVRRRHRPVGVGPRHHQRLERQRARRRAAGSRMQQATVNLFADMGAPADDADERPGRRVPVDRHDGARRRRSRSPAAGARSPTARTVTITGTATDTGGDGRRRRGLHRRRRHVAPGHGHDVLVLQLDRPRRADARRSWSRATDDSGNVETVVRRASPSTSAARARWPGPSVTPAVVDQQDAERGRGRRQVQGRPRRHGHRRALLQGDREHRHARRQPVDGDGTLLAHRDVQRRDRLGLAAADVHDARWPSPRARPTSRPTTRRAATTRRRRATSTARPGRRRTRSTARRCTPSAPTAAAPTASTPTRSSSTFPTSTFDGENYARRRRLRARSSRRAPVGTVDGDARPRLGDGQLLARRPTGGPPTRYIVTPFIGSTAQPPVTVTGTPPATSVDGQRPRRRRRSYTFKVQAANGSGTRPALGRVERGHADRRRLARARRPASPPSAANRQATVRWTAPNDGGRTITALHRHAVPRRRRAAPRPRSPARPPRRPRS